MNQIRISSVALEPGFNNSQARVEKDNTFKIVAVAAGAHFIRPSGPLRGWSLKSVMLDGRDITDTPLELRSGQQVPRVSVTFTNQINEINGTLTSDQGTPLTEYTVLAFSMDSSFWRPQSRHIGTARPDQTGKFRLRGLPSRQLLPRDRRSVRTGRVVRSGVSRGASPVGAPASRSARARRRPRTSRCRSQ